MNRRLRWLTMLWIGFHTANSPAQEAVRYVQPSAATGSSGAVVVPGLPMVQTTQLYPVNQDGQLVGRNAPEIQIEQVFQNLKDVLQPVSQSDVVKLNVYVGSDELVSLIQKTLAKQFPPPAMPAVSYVVTPLPVENALVALDATAVVQPVAGEKQTIAVTTKNVAARRATGNHPRVTVLPTGTRIYISGQAEKADTLAEATRLTLLSLEASLKFCGRGKADIAQVKCFLKPMKQVADVNVELEKFFAPLAVPAVSYVEWESTLPIEIEVVAFGGLVREEPRKDIEFLTPPGMTASPVFSRIAKIQHPTTIFVSGLYGAEGADGAQQVEQIFQQLGSLLKETGSDFQHLAKATYYVSRDEPSQKLNKLRPKFYSPQSPPAASKAQVRGVGKAGTGLTLDMIAVPAK